MRLFCAVFKHCVAFFLCKLTSHFVPFSFMKSLIISKLTKDFFGLFFSGTNTVVCQPLLKTWLLSRTTTTVQQFRRIRRLLLKPYDFYNSEMHFPLFFATTILTLLIQVFSVFFLLMRLRWESHCDHIMLMLVARPGFPWEDARSSMPTSRQCWKSGRERGRKQGKSGRF